jgi:hypothetical protein
MGQKPRSYWKVKILFQETVTSDLILLFFSPLFICAYIVWAISPLSPSLSFPSLPSPLLPRPPHFQAESVLPLSLILLKREYKQ